MSVLVIRLYFISYQQIQFLIAMCWRNQTKKNHRAKGKIVPAIDVPSQDSQRDLEYAREVPENGSIRDL